MILGATGDPAQLFLELGGALVALALAARLAARTGFSPIPLYIVTGIALSEISPSSLTQDFISTAADIGIILLLFTLGLEYSALELAAGLRRGIRSGIADFALNFPPGFVLALLLGWGMVAALVLGGVTYASSSGIVAKVLADLGRLANRETPPILSLLVFEDLTMAMYLPLLGVALIGTGLWSALASVTVALAVIGGVFLLALRHGHLVSRAIWDDSDEVLLLSTLGLLLLVSGLAERVHVSAAIGAFLLGIALSGPVADRARVVMGPLRDLFAATFFLFFALRIDLADFAPVILPVLALAFVSSATKVATGWFAAGAAGADPLGRLRAGTALIARGEFSIVIAGLGVTAGVEPDLSAVAAAYVLVTALAGPLATRYADTLGRALLASREPRPTSPGREQRSPRGRRHRRRSAGA